MPHVIVKLAEGRSEEEKQALTAKIVDAVTSTVNNNEDAVSVSIEEFSQTPWKNEVYDPIILGGAGKLYKKSG